jgi:hypothetical protein
MAKHRKRRQHTCPPSQATPEQEATLRKLRDLEEAIYPPAMIVLRDISTWRRLESFCEGKPGVLLWESGYLLCAADQIADWARLPDKPMTPGQFYACLRFMADFYAGRNRVFANCRDSTSYPLFRNLEQKGYLRIQAAESNEMAGEGFHWLTLSFLPKAATAGLRGNDAHERRRA